MRLIVSHRERVRVYAHRIRAWRSQGYTVKLIFLRLPSVEQVKARVQLRIQQGGHAIPPEVIARRFEAGLRNFERLYRPFLDEWQMIDNGGSVLRLLSEGGR